MGRQPCCDKIGLKRGPWSIEEDQKLMKFILNNGIQCWRRVPNHAGLLRCGKSCRLRWINYLRPDLKRGAFSKAEEDQIIQLHSHFGNRWSKIAAHFSGRTDNEIKNHWNTKIKKKLKLLGLDPQTHKPIEHNEDCDAKENTMHSKSMEELVDNLEGKLLDDSGSEKNQTSRSKNGIEKSGSGEDANCVHNNEMLWENSDAGSTVTPQTDPPNTFSSRTEEPLPEEVFFQQWIDNVNSMLLWDGFNSLEEMFYVL